MASRISWIFEYMKGASNFGLTVHQMEGDDEPPYGLKHSRYYEYRRTTAREWIDSIQRRMLPVWNSVNDAIRCA